ncbi:MAG: hypothetical protein M5U22_21500 [Thermoleophilia bacterium]|nr:hypothetical protein [Thermoleophilia bacterium]
MIVRILGEGQFEVDDARLAELNYLDEALVATCEAGDGEAFARDLEALVAAVRTAGTPVPNEYLAPSDLVLPGPDATLEEVQEMLGEEGLLPG